MMDKDAFLESHGHRITLGTFDRRLFRVRDDVVVTEECLDASELSGIHTPWYHREKDGNSELIDYDTAAGDKSARAILVHEDALIDLLPGHLDKINQYRKDYAAANPKEPLIIAEDTASGQKFFPDGNHTAIALHRNSNEGTKYNPIEALVIRGPQLEAVFGDIAIANRS